MKKMSFKCIFNWLYAKTLNRAMSERQPRENRAMNHSVYRPVCVSYVSRVSLVALLLLLLGGWNSVVWGADCNYTTINNFVSSKNTQANGDQYRIWVIYKFNYYDYYDVPTFEFGNVTNNYGISHVKLSLQFSGLHAITEQFQLQYKVGNGSWTNIGNKVTASVVKTDIDQDVSIAGASGQKVYFRLERVEKAKFTDTQTLTLSGFEVRMKSTISANVSSINFGNVTYGNSKSEDVTAYYTLNYSGDMTATCTGDFSATLGASCGCSTAQQTKTVTVKFTPTQAGTRTGTLTIKNPDGTQTTVSLTGTGVRANPTLKMNNSSVNVTTDQANPVTLNLANLKASGTTSGIGDFDHFEVRSADAGTGAKIEGVTINGNNFSSIVGGTYTIRAITKQNNQYNSTYKDFTVTVNRLTQTISWSTDESVFVEEDVISATSIGDVTLEKSGTGAEYVTIDGNTATVGEVETNSSVTLTATAAQTDVYAQATDSKTITLTSLQKQHITFEQNLTKLKTTDGTKKVELIATSDSGRDSYITFAVDANTAGVTVTKEGGKWYLNYSGTAVKGIAVTASLAGVDGVSVAASDVSQMVKVTDPTAKCDINEGLATASGLANTTKTYDLTIPKQVVLKVRSSKSKIYTNTYEVKFYDKNNKEISTGSTQSWTGRTWDQTIDTRTFSNLNKDIVKMVFKSNASNGFDITEASYTRWSYANPSVTELNFEALALSTVADKTFTLDYANYQVELSIEGSSNFVLKSDDSFGDCETYGTETIKIGYKVPAEATEETAFLYIKDNTGTELAKITLNATVQGGLTQNITSHNIGTAYKTTDLVNLTATTDRGLTNFSYSATPEGVANFDGAQMTFSKSGTIAITVTEAGNGAYAEASATVNNVVVSKVKPNIATNPSGTAVTYLQNLSASTLSDGSADVTLRGVANSKVDGSFAWTNPNARVEEAAGNRSYEVTFKPDDAGMYNNQTCQVAIQVNKADQTLAMNDGSVKVAVEGLDANAADSKLDLSTLIASQTTDPVNNNRVGAVTYKVISANASNATINGNIFSATAIGDYTIRATKAETDYYNVVTDDFVVKVSKRANTMAIAGTEYERFVDEEIADIRSLQNSDATVQTSSTSPTIAYYDVESNKILIPNSESDEQMFGAYKTVTIKIWQEATERFEACEKTITLAVKKYVTASNGENYVLKVNETLTANYGFENTSAPTPSNNKEDDFYYTIDEPNFENAELNNGTELITYDPATNQITGHNAGTTKITFFQKETYKYTGATLMCNIAVEKRENQIANSWSNVWQKAMAENGSENISFTSTHGDYANYPITIEQIYGEDVATLTGDASGASITTNTTKGYAIWHLSQAENYEYSSAEADVMVMVGVPAPPTCYVYQDNSEHEFMTHITDAEGHFEAQIAISAPVDKIWFYAKKDNLGVNKFAVQYSKDNGKNWKTFYTPTLDKNYKSEAFAATFPSVKESERITHVRFGAETGATLRKWYKDVRISRKAYLNIQDAEKKKISKLPTMTCTIDETSTAEAKFYIDYSTCDDEIIIESSNPVHFTVSRKSIDVSDKHDNLTSAKEEITVTYSSTELGTHNAVITVRTSYQTCALSVSGETTKRTPTLTWQEGYENNPLTLPIGLTVNALNPAATTTSTASVMYESDNEDVVRITENGYAFKVVGAGSAKLTAIVPENDKWKSVSDTRVINATAKVVQEIVWNQTFPRFMEPGNVIDLDAQVFLRNLSTSTLEYSEERTQNITYSCPLNNGIVTISGDKMTVLNYGEVKITASVSGDADYEASTMTILITVRQPSAGCETPLVLNREDAIDMYEWDVDFSDYLNLTTEEMISDEIVIDPTQGKPDKLSFRYEGEEFSIAGMKFFGGVIKFEQRVNSQWVSVEGSRVETVKNEWNARNNLQLDEQADALRIIREQGATGHHYIKDIQVTRKQYLRATKEMIDLGEVTLGQTTPVIIGFEYSDIKGDLTARTINNTTDVTIKDNGAIDLDCGSFGHYDLPVTFTPTQLGDWQGKVEIYDNIANLSIAVKLTATVVANEEYIFNHEGDWNTATNWTTNLVPDENADITVVKNMTINSAANVKSITIMDSATVTVKSGVTLVVGSGTPKNLPAYGNLHVEEGAQVLLDEEASLPLNDLILDAKLGTTDQHRTIASNSGQITNESKLIVNGDAYFRLAVDPSGHNTYGWYDFTVPFEVDVIGGISIAEEPSAVMKFNVNYAVMDYSEAKRAVNGKYWNKFSGTMQPGHIYTITLDDEMPWNTVVFKKKAGASATGDRSYTTEYSGLGTNNKDNGWNGFGNGTLHHTELDIPAGTLIQVYDHANKCYHTREAKDYSIAVGMTFVMQVPSVQTITLLTATSNSRFLAPARESSETDKFRLSLQAEGAENASDYLWVSASEDATGDYIIGRDVMKMGTMSASNVARIWSVRNSMNLCSNEMPMVNGEASCPLNIYAPVAGSYTLAIDKAPEDANLYLTYNGSVIWDLTASPYSLDLTKGTTTGYGLQLEVVNAPQITTGVDEIDSEKDGNRKVIINDAMYIITKEGAIFNATGKKVK